MKWEILVGCVVGWLVALVILAANAAAREQRYCFQHGPNVVICFTRLDATHCRMRATIKHYDINHIYLSTDHFGGKVRCKPVSQGGIR